MEEHQERMIPTFIPGDQIEYWLVFMCEANVLTVSATFRNQDTGTEVVLMGEARPKYQQGIIRTRVQEASLFYSNDLSETPEPGRYRLARLEATTFAGKPLDFDNPVEGEGFYFKEEPDPNLPFIIHPLVGFRLEEGHPNWQPHRR